MEVGTTFNIAQRAANIAPSTISVKNPNQETAVPFAKGNPAIDEKSMMDLQDVQRFLYMLIGSELKVESEQQSIGNKLNEVA